MSGEPLSKCMQEDVQILRLQARQSCSTHPDKQTHTPRQLDYGLMIQEILQAWRHLLGIEFRFAPESRQNLPLTCSRTDKPVLLPRHSSPHPLSDVQP